MQTAHRLTTPPHSLLADKLALSAWTARHEDGEKHTRHKRRTDVTDARTPEARAIAKRKGKKS